ncbi:MAG: hypothetical protein ACKVP3_04900 [Hyphomicrobiaceae bacterium]
MMNILETVVTEKSVRITLADALDLGEATEWMTIHLPLSALHAETPLPSKRLVAIQGEALRHARDAITAKIDAL